MMRYELCEQAPTEKVCIESLIIAQGVAFYFMITARPYW